MQCGLCNRFSNELFLTTIQLAGKFEQIYICPQCKAKRERELEMCRENFKRIMEVNNQ